MPRREVIEIFIYTITDYIDQATAEMQMPQIKIAQRKMS